MPYIKTIAPFSFLVLLLATIGLVFYIPLETLLLKYALTNFQAEYFNLFVKMSVLMGLGYFLVKKWNLTRIAGLSNKDIWKFKYLNLIPVYLILLGIATVISTDLANLLACLAVGFAEELLFRGVLQALFLRKYIHSKSGIFLATFIPALAFGLFHLTNVFKGEPLLAVIIQVIFATFIGFFFGVLLLKTNKLIPLAITHALINFSFSLQFLPAIKGEMTQEPSTLSIAPIIIFLPLFITALLLLKTINKTALQEKINQRF